MNKHEGKIRIRLVSAKDCDVSSYCGSGAGGQARNKVHSAIQIIHRESGAIGRSSESRSQLENKCTAFIRLTKTPKFKLWLNKKLYEIRHQETIEEAVDRQIAGANVRTEMMRDGKWVEVDASELSDAEAA